MASYSLTTAAIALGVDRKRLENLLLRGAVPWLPRGRQGKLRRLGLDSVTYLAAVVRLRDEIGAPAGVAAKLLDQSGERRLEAKTTSLGPITVTIDFPALASEVARELAAALEVAPRPRRGRPRK